MSSQGSMTTENAALHAVASPGAPADHGTDGSLDRLNLEQALRDFELANRRVVDLAQRVASLHRELLEAKTELSVTRAQLHQANRYVERIRASRVFPLLRMLRQAKRAIR